MWIYNNNTIDETILENYIAFVYLITNLTNNRKYIGKKLLKFRRTKTVKGKKKKLLIESDWKTYWGSNKDLQADVKELGETNFKREILHFCKTKGESNYLEAKLQFDNNVLLSDEWYNGQILVRLHSSHVKGLTF